MEKTMAGMGAIAAATGEMPTMGDSADPVTLPLLQDHAAADWRDVIVRTECPMLLVAAEESQFWPFDHAISMSKESPLVSAVVIEDCGHPVNIDQPDIFNEALLSFMAG
jgi:pimeloyl-ACP methyl ester carboxylesterase